MWIRDCSIVIFFIAKSLINKHILAKALIVIVHRRKIPTMQHEEIFRNWAIVILLEKLQTFSINEHSLAKVFVMTDPRREISCNAVWILAVSIKIHKTARILWWILTYALPYQLLPATEEKYHAINRDKTTVEDAVEKSVYLWKLFNFCLEANTKKCMMWFWLCSQLHSELSLC